MAPADASGEALLAERDTQLGQPSRLTFAWSAQEPDFRGSGVGVARVEPPDRARLDLFLDNGETAAIAALVGDELRIPDALPTELVPPPALLWAALGVFRPGVGAEQLSAGVAEGVLEADYRLSNGDRARFRLRNRAIVDAALLQRGSVVEQVFVSGRYEQTAYPARATYRNLPDFRELKLELEAVENVDRFPPEIWEPNDT